MHYLKINLVDKSDDKVLQSYLFNVSDITEVFNNKRDEKYRKNIKTKNDVSPTTFIVSYNNINDKDCMIETNKVINKIIDCIQKIHTKAIECDNKLSIIEEVNLY